MSEYKFDEIDKLKRRRDIEGETGTELGLEGTEIKLTVLAATDANPQWRARGADIRAELNRLNNAKAPAERVRKFLARIYAECIVKGWRGVKNDGVEIPFSVEACEAFLLAADDAYAAIDGIIYETRNFRQASIEAVVSQAGE